MSRRRKHRKPRRDWAALEAKAREQLDRNRRRLEHATRNGHAAGHPLREADRQPEAAVTRIHTDTRWLPPLVCTAR